jgi:hypothetical protein
MLNGLCGWAWSGKCESLKRWKPRLASYNREKIKINEARHSRQRNFDEFTGLNRHDGIPDIGQ